MIGFVAAGVIGILIGEPERGVPHLVDRNLGGSAGERIGAD